MIAELVLFSGYCFFVAAAILHVIDLIVDDKD
jgi:hypothetical protein